MRYPQVRSFPSCFCFLLVLAAFTWSNASAADLLQWKLKADARLNVTTEQTVVTNTIYTGNSVESKLTLLIESQWKVTRVADDAFELSQTVTRAKIEMQSPKTDAVVYDSAEEKRPTGVGRQLQTAIKPLIGAEVKLRMTPRGEILSAEPPPELSTSNSSETGSNAASPSPEALKSLLSKALLLLPQEEVEIGASWEDASVNSLPTGEVKLNKTYRLVGVEDGDSERIATIEGDGKVELDPKGKLKLTDGQFSQTASFAIEDGLLRSTEQKVRLKTENPYRDTTIAVDMTMTLKTTLQRLEK